ncbi:arsenical pump membrane protein [Lebetimonas natsushimae]|uniref:Arsenical pump membrane protein n=1 Tax=Lebetimonas natsushimae TaxID=1936991 RepID=A0A292YE77_9BACT|nr:arsenical efflux pump membrane protein ArsB [Lebetimonas natsushimae]GAX87434.1 arsenical pump membrane protein [Lebetimonas natsushimae]
MILALSIFLITLILILWQPKGLQIGTSAIIGATATLILGLVNFNDVIEIIKIVWDATLAFIGIIILSTVLEKNGFFEYTAIKIAKLSRGSGNLLFVNSIILGSIVAAFFANDGAALILTPILLSKLKMLKLNIKTIISFLLAGGFISDAASLPFEFSNLTNIITADYFHIGFIKYFSNMVFPYILSTISSTFILWIFFKKNIPKKININLLPNENSVIKDKKLFKISWFFLGLLLISYFISDIYHIPISFFAFGGAMIFLLISQKIVNTKEIIKTAPWQIIWFSIGLFIIVYGLKNEGLTDYLTVILKEILQINKNLAIIATGFISGILSAVMNNLPTVIIMDISLKSIGNEAMIYANIIGANIGPKMTPFGSLSTLLLLHIAKQKGINITFKEYIKFAIIITPIVLLIVLLTLI